MHLYGQSTLLLVLLLPTTVLSDSIKPSVTTTSAALGLTTATGNTADLSSVYSEQTLRIASVLSGFNTFTAEASSIASSADAYALSLLQAASSSGSLYPFAIATDAAYNSAYYAIASLTSTAAGPKQTGSFPGALLAGVVGVGVGML
ncbi:MAG: hypothetical protein M1820_001265 [Bogoriella megaspora]|nr:MAG: hypothetical protein M1820_001265 [Bogoriella megaspora]